LKALFHFNDSQIPPFPKSRPGVLTRNMSRVGNANF
jgi:hypothetical protein